MWCPYARSKADSLSVNRWTNSDGQLQLSSCLGGGCPKFQAGIKDVLAENVISWLDYIPDAEPVDGQIMGRCTA